MSIDARLDRLSTVLTARERAILVLHSLREKTPEDPSWRNTMPRDQTPEFNRLIVLMNACNIYLPLLITTIELTTERLYGRLHWLITLTQYGTALWNVAELLPASRRKRAERLVEGTFPLIELPWNGEEHERSWINIAENMERALRKDVAGLWMELRAVDIVVGEVAQEFNGEDPLRPIMREVLEKSRAELVRLHAFLSELEVGELPEPDEDTLGLVRAHFENGKRLMAAI